MTNLIECVAPNLPINVFLAGGICGCKDWQGDIVALANTDETFNNVVLFNPRRRTFDVSNPVETDIQIKWEFYMLERMDVFSMFFDGSNSDQPICQYELGRNIVRMQHRFPDDWYNRIVITCDSKYSRKDDVVRQVKLATSDKVPVCVLNESEKISVIGEHFNAISRAIKNIRFKYTMSSL